MRNYRVSFAKYRLQRDKNNKNPYDLNAMEWVCQDCGGIKEPSSPYSPRNPFKKYCTCNRRRK